MDKYQLDININKMDQALKEGRNLEAKRLADEVDWRKVPSIKALTMASEIYEKNKDYNEAREILKLAYERAPHSKQLIYKLTLLSIEDGNILEAEGYYKEYYDNAPDDPRQHILRYMILKAKKAPVGQLINSLEQYCDAELSEQWMYELAELYFEAGREDECIEMCDKIMVMFGIGYYVDKAMNLKLNRLGVPLDAYQQRLLENARKVDNVEIHEQTIPQEVTVEEVQEAPVDYAAGQPEEGIPEETPAPAADEPVEVVLATTLPQEITAPETTVPETTAPESEETPDEEINESNTEEEDMTIYTVNFIVERRSEQDGLDAAIRLLKLMHEHTGSKNKVAKIKAEKLNSAGVYESREKLKDKDLVVEQAGDLAFSSIQEIIDLIRDEPDKRVIVLIDNPMQVRNMLEKYPDLSNLFHVDRDDKAEEKAPASVPEPAPEPEREKAPIRLPSGGENTKTSQELAMEKKMKEEEMDINEFADYAQSYADSIDCAIDGKSKLALYERIEIMEEDGIPLTRENAVSLVEEAADHAEKHKFAGMFKPKYDKDDRLILREEDFIQ